MPLMHALKRKLQLSRPPVFLCLFFCAAVVSCSKRQAAEPVEAEEKKTTAGKVDACSLLTSEEIQAIQGEPLKETKPNDKSGGGLAISECYFALPTSEKSILVTVMQKADGPDARDPKQFWEEAIGRQHERDRKKGREGAGKLPTLDKIEGLGDEALWAANPFGGVLHVLKGHRYIKISAGGTSDPRENAPKAKRLAEHILKRL